MPSTHAPDDLVIHPRNLRFGTEGKPQRWWLNGDSVATAWHNALSITFPAGETFFIESVRRFQKQVPESLARQIKDFAKQEAFHTREHNEFNARVEADGYEIASEVARVEERLREARERHPVGQLAMTVALEHFTAIFAHSALKNPALMDETDRDSQRMWAWHAIEEIEHKSVAFDTYVHVMRDAPARKRWGIRCLVFLNVSRNFMTSRWTETLRLLEQDGITGWSARRKLLGYLLGNPGVVRRIILPWLAFLRPGFHPWEVDDRALIGEAQARYGFEDPAVAAE